MHRRDADEDAVNKVRIAVAGAGMIGLRHIEEIQKSRSAVLSAIVDPMPKAAEVARAAGVPLFTSLADPTARVTSTARTPGGVPRVADRS